MNAREFILKKVAEETQKIEDGKLLITQTIASANGLVVTSRWETPETLLSPVQLEIKQMVNPFGYKVRLPYLTWFWRVVTSTMVKIAQI